MTAPFDFEGSLPKAHRPVGLERVRLLEKGPDALGRFHFTLLWRAWNPNTASVTIRAQCFFARPGEIAADREIDLRPADQRVPHAS